MLQKFKQLFSKLFYPYIYGVVFTVTLLYGIAFGSVILERLFITDSNNYFILIVLFIAGLMAVSLIFWSLQKIKHYFEPKE